MSDASVAPTLLERVRAAGLDASGLETNSALAVEYRTDAARTVAEFGRTLAALHSLLDTADDVRGVTEVDAVALAALRRAAFERGELEGHTVGSAYAHLSVERLLTVLEDGAAAAAERAGPPVLTHGRPQLSTFRWQQWTPVGLVDWDHLALADRNRDLAVAARSIVVELEPVFLPAFFDAYGHQHLDLLQLDWYSLALELEPWTE